MVIELHRNEPLHLGLLFLRGRRLHDCIDQGPKLVQGAYRDLRCPERLCLAHHLVGHPPGNLRHSSIRQDAMHKLPTPAASLPTDNRQPFAVKGMPAIVHVYFEENVGII